MLLKFLNLNNKTISVTYIFIADVRFSRAHRFVFISTKCKCKNVIGLLRDQKARYVLCAAREIDDNIRKMRKYLIALAMNKQT